MICKSPWKILSLIYALSLTVNSMSNASPGLLLEISGRWTKSVDGQSFFANVETKAYWDGVDYFCNGHCPLAKLFWSNHRVAYWCT